MTSSPDVMSDIPGDTATTAPKVGTRPAPFATAGKMQLMFVFAILIYAIRQKAGFGEILSGLDFADNDDVMRLLSVRAWLDGQGWFDMTQHRFLPPEGLSLHWSRYVDAAIGSLIAFLGLFLAPETAERFGVALWPGLVFVTFLAVIARASTRLFGYQAASVALIVAGMLTIYTAAYFSAGRIDHHNLQILFLSIVAYGLARPDAPLRGGVVAGLGAAASLTVGLEGLLFIGFAGLICTGAAILRAEQGARLLGFGMAMALAAPLLFAGQTAPADWFVRYCDALALPVLWITSVAGLFALVVGGSVSRLGNPLMRAVLAVPLGIVALAVLWPQVQHCSGGPYADLTEEVRREVLGRIRETAPLLEVASGRPHVLIDLVLPVFLSCVAGLVFALRRASRIAKSDETYAATILLLLLWGGFLGTFYQLRMLVSAYAVLPMVFGYVIYCALDGRDTAKGLRTLIGVVAGFGTIFATFIAVGWLAMTKGTEAVSAEKKDAGVIGANCSSQDAMSALNTVAPTMILTSLNLGTRMVLFTHHDAMAAPYHRNNRLMRNGILPYVVEEDRFEDEVRATGAGHILFCRNTRYGPEGVMARDIARGEASPAWLEPVPLPGDALMLYRVLPGEAGQ